MEYLQTFNEHQKRKFKSFQKEKQDAIDKKEEEERRKSYGNYGSSYNYGGWSEYDEDNWHNRRVAKATERTPPDPRRKSSVYILSQTEREVSKSGKPRIIYEECLKDLFPGTDVRKLAEACVLIENKTNLFGISPNKDYELQELSWTEISRGLICIISDNGVKCNYGGGIPDRFRKFKVYPFDVYAIPLPTQTISSENNLTRAKPYKLIGESEELYEILDDANKRRGFPKIWFGLPFKKSKHGGFVISKTEINKALSQKDKVNQPKKNEPRPIDDDDLYTTGYE